MTARRSPCSGFATLLALPSLAFAENLEGSFFGHAVSAVSDPPGTYTIGESYAAYLTLDTTPSSGATWYPWNQADFEYTFVLTTSVQNYVPGAFWNVTFAPASSLNPTNIRIYADERESASFTAADYSDPATFTDGALILAGASNNLSGWGSGGQFWGMFGALKFIGGSGLGALTCHPHVSLELNGNAGVIIASPQGYDEYVDFLWNCEGAGDVTAIDAETWGRVKASYR